MRSFGGGEIEWRWSRSLLDRRGAIGTVLRSTRPVECGSSDWSSICGRRTGARSEECAVVVVGLELGLRTGVFLSLSLSLSLRVSPEMV